MASTRDKVSEMKPYVDRALKDEDVRDHLMSAFTAAKEVYDELVGARAPVAVASRVATDKDVQENLRRTVEELRAAADRVQGKDEHTGRNTALLLAGITVGLLFNPVTGRQTRQWLKDRVFGPSDDFTYGGDGGQAAA